MNSDPINPEDQKWEPKTRGGYPVRNIRRNTNIGPYVISAEIQVKYESESGEVAVWACETFTNQGQLLTWKQTEKDLIQVTE
jgi:hypothetical protein